MPYYGEDIKRNQTKGEYKLTVRNVMLHWPLIKGCYSEEGPGRAASRPCKWNKCNSPPIDGQCSNFILFDVAL